MKKNINGIKRLSIGFMIVCTILISSIGHGDENIYGTEAYSTESVCSHTYDPSMESAVSSAVEMAADADSGGSGGIVSDIIYSDGSSGIIDKSDPYTEYYTDFDYTEISDSMEYIEGTGIIDKSDPYTEYYTDFDITSYEISDDMEYTDGGSGKIEK